jgi:hypothetical protein
MSVCNPLLILPRRIVLSIVIAATALMLMAPVMISPPSAYAQSAAQPDPAWDFGRGGAESAGQPACYLPSPNQTDRKMYSLMRPSCYPGHMQ